MWYVTMPPDIYKQYPFTLSMLSTLAEELAKLFARVGVTKEILTDQGSNFTSQLLQVYQLLHIQPIRTSPYHPQTDGLVERFRH